MRDAPAQLQRPLHRRDRAVWRALSDRGRGARSAQRPRVPPRAARSTARQRAAAGRRRAPPCSRSRAGARRAPPKGAPPEPTQATKWTFSNMGPPSQCSRLRGCLATRRGRGSIIRARMPRCGRGSRPTLRALTISTGCDGRMGFAVRCVGGRRRGSCQTGGGRAESAGGGCRRRRGRSSTGRGRR